MKLLDLSQDFSMHTPGFATGYHRYYPGNGAIEDLRKRWVAGEVRVR